MKKAYLLLFLIIIFLGFFFLSSNSDKAYAHSGSYGFAKIAADGDMVKITLLIDSLSIAEFPGVDANHDEIIDQDELKNAYDEVVRPYMKKA